MYRTNDRIQDDHYLVFSYNYYKFTYRLYTEVKVSMRFINRATKLRG